MKTKLINRKDAKVDDVLGLSPIHILSYNNGNTYYINANFKICKRHQIAVTPRKVLSYGMILSFHWILCYGRGYHDLSVTCIVTQTEKNSEKQPVFKDISGDSKKVVTVRRGLMETMCAQLFSTNFGICCDIVDLIVRSAKIFCNF